MSNLTSRIATFWKECVLVRVSHVVLMPGRGNRFLCMIVISGSGLPANIEFFEDGLKRLDVVVS